ncbi:hypothetical protein M409DRAFT_55781 [Zasmidium cellare ATCC 36951]|uniref:Zinc/iron permease n=1 Tax=Zasmidium cellare ATCC 36951 TaxID=1080233 RepID=A0A6A6CI51_ZASCE|nr:uncharacterized protein M409DRAFT_55781 [Zasmidium cellare ATCC 36951]KAF2165369.1 hypothetical protein M409DRAFT_55781 [Zasmidium cellare ATCC 36951]
MWLLLLLCLVMGTASFLAGILPLSLSLSPRQLRLITALGTGVLVGTSLIVIIPEGVETLYTSSGSGHGHDKRAVSLTAKMPSLQGEALPIAHGHPSGHSIVAVRSPLEYDDTDTTFRTGPDDGFYTSDDSDKLGHDGHGMPIDHDDLGQDSASDDEDDRESHDPHAWIGISLILGFILMYLIDTLPQHATTPSKPQRFQISLNQFSFNRSSSTSNENAEQPAADTFATSDTASHPQGSTGRPSSTTVGLVIHAAADGIALGASSTNSNSKLSFIIFIALMIHKAPAAFGLTSVLLKQGLSKRMARAHLIVFSLAAPIGAILTYAAVHLFGFSSASLSNNTSTEFATGVLLLFSGGTFLYVAMHTMQETGAGEHSHGEGQAMNGYAGVPMDDPYSSHAPTAPKPQGPALVDTLVTVGGMLLPLLTQFGHGH